MIITVRYPFKLRRISPCYNESMSSESAIKVLAFDFFGVICGEVAPIWFERYFLHEKASELKDLYMRAADTGRVSMEDTFHALAQLVNMSEDQVKNDWYELSVIDQEVLSRISELRDKYKIVLCSNAMSEFIRNILKKNAIEQLFDEIYISSEIHEAKPDVQYFRKVIEDLKVSPSAIMYFDDSLANVKAAKVLGLNAIHFRDIHTLDIIK